MAESAGLTNEIMNAAEQEAIGRMIYEGAMDLLKGARANAATLNLSDRYVGAMLSAAAGFALAEHVADIPALNVAISVAQGTVAEAARGRFDDRVVEAKLIKGVAGKV